MYISKKLIKDSLKDFSLNMLVSESQEDVSLDII